MKAKLFKDSSFLIVESASLSMEEAYRLQDALIENGCDQNSIVVEKHDLTDSILNSGTIIANDIDFEGYDLAENKLIPVVTSKWCYDSIRNGRLNTYKQYSPNPALFFKDVFLCISDIPPGDKEAVISGVLAFGGQCMDELTKFTTHLVTTDNDDPKCTVANHYNSTINANNEEEIPIKIVLPHWINDCLRLKRRIDESPYLFPNPRFLQYSEINDSSSVHHIEQRLNDEANNRLKLPRTISDFKEFGNESDDFLVGKCFFFYNDLNLSSFILSTIQEMITNNGGKITTNISEANCVVCHYRKGPVYIEASTKDIPVGNLNWLYWMFSHHQWISPLEKLLHYPYVFGKLPGFEKFVISVTNFTGDARLYVHQLVTLMGGEFTRTLSQKNTHLIVSKPQGLKYEVARTWKDIKLVNHLWLEECYRNWKVLNDKDPVYVHFPKETNLTQILGSTSLDKKVLKQFYEKKTNKPKKTSERKTKKEKLSQTQSSEIRQVDSALSVAQDEIQTEISQNSSPDGIERSNQRESQPSITQDSMTSTFSDSNKKSPRVQKEDTKKQTIEPKLKEKNGESHKKIPPVKRPLLNVTPEKENFQPQDSELSKGSFNHKLSPENNSHNQAISSQQSRTSIVTVKSHSATESGIASSPPAPSAARTSSRKAKSKAAAKLHDDMEDLNLFQKQSKRKNLNYDVSDGDLKRAKIVQDSAVVETEVILPSKYSLHAITTGCTITLSKVHLKKLSTVGIKIVDNPSSKVNCIISPSIMRTEKFLITLSKSPNLLLHESFLLSVLQAKQEQDLPELEEYSIGHHIDFKNPKVRELFVAPELGNENIVKLASASNASKLFDSFNFNISSSLPAKSVVISRILESFGAAGVKTLSSKKPLTEKDVKGLLKSSDNAYYIICLSEDKILQESISQVLTKQDENYKMVEWNWVIRCIFNLQVLLKDEDYIITERMK
ncbi:Mms22-dependent DNA repair involved protein [Komagataella phaffii CBS 7435]|uniref:Protein implicated in Mms22-dependent DNA repair during S phase n=2 Tax=Komagataella phaffii TaxID=460519 RepID=C4R1B3_KOMPG|nr:Protein implicated in Mms22-dependent DNA repair during S phase [Komagataella phaffii GS115]AOA62329.1 GQ67_00706T0 [Komagataella phaffii]CAH2448186.1 Mms22-dependent DNA repair involved protein [Komagataella phaffii CBS 7435]AOA67475.1 GQ68_00683T0 [Komagataella phaffii GS115]CAY69287.1 Protein implicated in Mms22-dependent DNA repair during S phase [Komagataella phaffii GS115]CCA38324.1 Mms22-dependent DNA repair involved protein [Komagataella phaffii CBS 7435]